MISSPTDENHKDQRGRDDYRFSSRQAFWLGSAVDIQARPCFRYLTVAGYANASFRLIGDHIVKSVRCTFYRRSRPPRVGLCLDGVCADWFCGVFSNT